MTAHQNNRLLGSIEVKPGLVEASGPIQLENPHVTVTPHWTTSIYAGPNVVGKPAPGEEYMTMEVYQYDWGLLSFIEVPNSGTRGLTLTADVKDIHHFLKINICLVGELTLEPLKQREAIDIRKGEFGLIVPAESEGLRFVVGPNRRFIGVGALIAPSLRTTLFDESLLEGDLAQLNNPVLSVPCSRVFPCSATLKRIVQEAWSSPYTGGKKYAHRQAKGIEALTELAAVIDERGNPPDDTVSCSDEYKVIRARDMLVAHLDTPLHSKALAREAGMTPRKLNHLFRKTFGLSMRDYQMEQRMEYARRSFNKGDSTVSQVAAFLGYAHTGNFITAYRKRFGVTPGSQRK